MKTGDVCNPTVIGIDTGASVHEAARLMREEHVGDLVITQQRANARVPIGIVTDRDLVLEVIATDLDTDAVTVGDLFSSAALVTASVDDGLETTISRMHENGVRRIPVTHTDGTLAGIITMDDVLRVIADQLGTAVDFLTRQSDLEARRRV